MANFMANGMAKGMADFANGVAVCAKAPCSLSLSLSLSLWPLGRAAI